MINLKLLLKEKGKLFSEELGIKLPKEAFKWFLASILFGGRISAGIAKNTYKEFEKQKLVTPRAIYFAGWDRLVEVLDRGGYVRYDFSTADDLLAVTKKLLEEYNGKIEKLDKTSSSPRELEQRLQELRGVGPVTSAIFLRELRGFWKNANPKPTRVELLGAKKLGIKNIKQYWNRKKIKGYDFRHFETMLVRVGLEK